MSLHRATRVPVYAPSRKRTLIFPRARRVMHADARWQNERKFGSWEELPGGGRRYIRGYVGRAGGRAGYLKEVDAAETTTRFAQEIYDRDDRLVSVHEKFPVDLGHKQI